MLESIKKYIRERKQWLAHENYVNGFDWAAGALLRKEETPMSIDAYMDSNRKTSFDMGAEDAINMLEELGLVEDNRI